MSSSKMKRRVTEDLKEVKKKLETLDLETDPPRSLSPKPLASEPANEDPDSGLGSSKELSRNASAIWKRDSELHLSTGGVIESVIKEEESGGFQCPDVVAENNSSLSHDSEKTQASPSSGDGHLLSTSLSRNTSGSSISSDKYFTPPTSPPQLIARTIPLDSLSSVPKELKIGFSINLHELYQACNEQPCEAISLERYVQVSLSIHPASDIIRRRRLSSSSSSTPTTPKLSLKPISRSLDKEESPNISPEMPRRNTNRVIKAILYENIEEFVKWTNLKALCTHLISVGLVSGPDLEELNAKEATNRGKNIYFYTGLMETKGPDAYRRLYDCLKNEQEHLGHKNLARIVDKKLKYHMFRNDFP